MVEIRIYLRNPAAVGFTLAFPLMMLVLFASVFHGKVKGTDIDYSQVFVAGIIGSSIMSVSFVGLATGIVVDRDAGVLRRLATTPVPRSAYFIGKMISSLALAFLGTVVCMIAGAVLFGLDLPTSPGRWITFVWVLVLGVGAATAMAVVVGGRITSPKSAPAVVNLPFVALQFVSGVFVPPDQLPKGLYQAAGIFPLRWIGQGMRSVFLPDAFQQVEPTGSWQHPMVALVLAGWIVFGLVAARLTFRWFDRH
jgi:ABC-2 type transport system permease protein